MQTHELYARSPIQLADGIPVFSTPDRYTENYDRIAADHLSVFEREGRNPFQAEPVRAECERSTADLVRKYAKPGDSIVDVGCGMGTLLEPFDELRRHGMDISLAYLRYARRKQMDVCLARIEDMPYHDESFDIVTCTDVLEHVLDLNACVERILRILKPGGLLIIRVPYREDLSTYLDPALPYEFVHLRQFDEWSLRLLVEKVFGCTVLEQTLAAHRAGTLRVGARLPKVPTAIRLGLDYMERAGGPVNRAALAIRRRLFTPTVINTVARKRSA